MTHKILIAYASRTGSTQGVAEAIGKTLSETGIEADIWPVEKVLNLDAYQAVVVGSAIQSGAWLPEAMRFIQTHREPLQRKPFAAFLVCMTLAMPKGESYRPHVSNWLAPVRALVRPVSEGLFAGRLDLNKIKSPSARLKFRLSVWLGVWSEGDHRNWNEIRLWAADLYPRLFVR